MKVAIVDDELLFAKNFSKTVRQIWGEAIENLDIFLSAESILSTTETYDIMFLDIEMPRLTGIELARRHKVINPNTKIIFVTNRDDLVFEAYNTTRAIGFVRKFSIDSDLKSIVKIIEQNNQQRLSLSVKSGDAFIKIRYCDILYIEKVAHNIVIFTADASYNKRTTITDIETELASYGFVRTHIGYLVNLAHIRLIKSNSAVLSGGKNVPISRHNIKSVRNKFLERNVELNE